MEILFDSTISVNEADFKIRNRTKNAIWYVPNFCLQNWMRQWKKLAG